MKNLILILIITTNIIYSFDNFLIYNQKDSAFYSIDNTIKLKVDGDKCVLNDANKSFKYNFNDIEFQKFKIKINISNNSTEVDAIQKIIINKSQEEINFTGNMINFSNKSEKSSNFKYQSDKKQMDFSSYIGSGFNYMSGSVSIDEENNIYMAGICGNYYFFIPDSLVKSGMKSNADNYIIKFDQNGNIKWIFYIGSSAKEGSIYICTKNGILWGCGETNGNDFPIKGNPISTVNSGGTADLTYFKLDYDGNLLFSGLAGSLAYDTGLDVKIDKNDNAWITGRTFGGIQTTSNAYQKNHIRFYDSYLIGFDKTNKLIVSTIFGTENDELAESLEIVDSLIYITGMTNSSVLPLKSNNYNGGEMDIFLTCFDLKGKPLWSKYYGGYDWDVGQNLNSDGEGNLILTGLTNSSNFPNNVTNTTLSGGIDRTILKLDRNGNIIWSYIYGGSKDEGFVTLAFQAGGVFADSKNQIYFSGRTLSSDLPEIGQQISNPFNTKNWDSYLAKLTPDGQLIESAKIIGDVDDIVRDIVVDKNDNLIIVGVSSSLNLPLNGKIIKPTNSGLDDGFIMKFGTGDIKPDPCKDDFNSFEIADFSSKDKISLVDDAITYDSVLRLTNDKNFQSGAVWIDEKVNPSVGFKTNFSFRCFKGSDNGNTDGSTPGADGIAFIIGNTDEKIGLPGGGIGYHGLNNVLAIELDLFKNPDNPYNDPNGNHLAVFSSKDFIIPNHNGSQLISDNLDIEDILIDATIYEMEIIYSGEQKSLEVYLGQKNTNLKRALKVTPFVLEDYIDLDNNLASIGITAATGDAVQQQELLSWEFCGNITSGIINKEISEFIYPNPVTNELFIDNEKFIDFEIYDINGKLILSDKLNFGMNKINCNTFDNGFYMIKLNGKVTEVFNFIKI